jgi:hypothetical protein
MACLFAFAASAAAANGAAEPDAMVGPSNK